MELSPEAYGIGGVCLAIIAILMVFVKSLVRRQDQVVQAAGEVQERMFQWFTKTMNGTLESLKDTLHNNREAMKANAEAMEHNTKNLKATQELMAGVVDKIIANERESDSLMLAKIEELLARDRSRTRDQDSEGGELHK